MDFNEMERRLDQWQLDKYQTPIISFNRAMTKFSEETIELHKAVHKEDRQNTLEEIGDVLFCLHRLCRALGTDLMTVAEPKLEEVEKKLEKKR